MISNCTKDIIVTNPIIICSYCDTCLIQSGAAGSEKGFVKCSMKVPLACMAASVQPNCLWNCQKTFYKTFFTPAAPDCMIIVGKPHSVTRPDISGLFQFLRLPAQTWPIYSQLRLSFHGSVDYRGQNVAFSPAKDIGFAERHPFSTWYTTSTIDS